jgi:hypothetical protein
MAKRTLTRLGVLVLALGLLYGGLNVAGATGPPGLITGVVTVGNTPSNPVPVQQQGTATVTGTVKTSAADNPAFQPVAKDCDHGGTGSANCDLYTVPSGKELVVTLVSMGANVGGGGGDFLVQATFTHRTSQEFGGDVFVPMSKMGTDSHNVNWYLGALMTQFYVPAGQVVSCGAVADLATDVVDVECNMHGYLVDVPS